MPAPPMPPHASIPRKFLLGGEWIDTLQRMSIVSPWTGKVLYEICEAGEEHARLAGEAARKVMPEMRRLTGAQRSESLRTIASKIAFRADEMAALIRDEVGKPMGLCRIEVQRAIKTFLLGAEEALRLPGDILYPDQEPQGAGMVGRIQYFPSGPILGISPFNFPLNLVAHKVAPALAAGCPIVIKPPPQGPGAALVLGEIALESGLPRAALQILPGGLPVAQALCANDAFAVISFTGSARVGWAIKKNALSRQKVLLELGGNAAVIVDDSADIDLAARAVSASGYVYAGQTCISTQRIYVHHQVADLFERKLAEKILTEIVVSDDPGNEKAFVGPLIDKNAADRIDQWIQSAVAHGAKVLIKGERRSERLITPWLLKDVPSTEPLACEEVFGPVIVMREVRDLSEAITQTNASRYGLQTSIFTQSLRNAELAYKEIDSGAILVNIPTAFRLDAALYGGIKDSGFGREGVKEVVRAFCEPKMLVVKP